MRPTESGDGEILVDIQDEANSSESKKEVSVLEWHNVTPVESAEKK